MFRGRVGLSRIGISVSLAALTASGLTVVACKRVDPLSAMENTDGVMLVDARIGSDGRIVCVLPARTGACNSNTANVYVRGIPRFGALRAHWKEQDVVEVLVFGGEVVRCRNAFENSDIRIELKHLPGRQADDEWDDSDTHAFDSVVNSCR